jgi:hypothetical protein
MSDPTPKTMSDPTPEIAKSDSPTDEHSTVQFNVSGRHYEVSRSLIAKFPSTMLARMISETWQKDPEVALFIDRDSDRFRFCLDYMRADKVWLPLNIPKEALLDDLDFYGFEDVDPCKIHGGSSYVEAARSLRKCKEEHEKAVKVAETTSKCEEVAYECFVRFSRGESLMMRFAHNDVLFNTATDALANPADFQDRLAKYGLACVKSGCYDGNYGRYDGNYGLSLTLKEKEDAIN